jgi:hypothetical protein
MSGVLLLCALMYGNLRIALYATPARCCGRLKLHIRAREILISVKQTFDNSDRPKSNAGGSSLT